MLSLLLKEFSHDDFKSIYTDNYLTAIYLKVDSDTYLSQITFWDNLMYKAEIYSLNLDKWLLEEDLLLKDKDDCILKYSHFIKILNTLK